MIIIITTLRLFFFSIVIIYILTSVNYIIIAFKILKCSLAIAIYIMIYHVPTCAFLLCWLYTAVLSSHVKRRCGCPSLRSLLRRIRGNSMHLFCHFVSYTICSSIFFPRIVTLVIMYATFYVSSPTSFVAVVRMTVSMTTR